MERRGFLKTLCAVGAIVVVAPTALIKETGTKHYIHGGLMDLVRNTDHTYTELTEEALRKIIEDIVVQPASNSITIWTGVDGLKDIQEYCPYISYQGFIYDSEREHTGRYVPETN